MVSDHLRVVQKFSEEIEQQTPWPRPHCPTCREGFVSWDKPAATETKLSRSYRDHEGWEPDWISGTMHVIGHCENVECEQVVIAVGTYKVDVSINRSSDRLRDEYQGQLYSEFYKLHYFNPPLVLLKLPEGVPQDVRDAIDRAAPIMFVDPSFAATALRGSVERFLTGEGILALNPAGSRTTLHRRIQLWEDKTSNNRVADLLRAVKWIGNEGTHEGIPLTVRDVLDGLEFMESAFHELLVTPEITGRMRAVNLAKGRYQADGPTAS